MEPSDPDFFNMTGADLTMALTTTLSTLTKKVNEYNTRARQCSQYPDMASYPRHLQMSRPEVLHQDVTLLWPETDVSGLLEIDSGQEGGVDVLE